LVIRCHRDDLAMEARMLAKEISVKRYVVRLSGGERQQLETLVTGAPAAEGTDIVEGRCLGGR
jgi:hypothetical protein